MDFSYCGFVDTACVNTTVLFSQGQIKLCIPPLKQYNKGKAQETLITLTFQSAGLISLCYLLADAKLREHGMLVLDSVCRRELSQKVLLYLVLPCDEKTGQRKFDFSMAG